ncbi:siphovirus Gp157 family protein [Escherichia coli]|uniref:siphovirus Gp157 family protein n=1 Tax=Escherichia fergusonii TaxID=564 RepID=UPI0015E95CC5|nr:siphovirus Gp157 family protein [Escherichia fergusonii]MBI1074387.1 siphovirus Gp157 family protein [Escherichia coli]MCN2350140.1 siphovirus Gp157 family protein [Escherichia coli]MCN2497826.1 siphovirus Gp157 family protein [Escherichia coli]QMC78202.1 siphovirus Gp157 family protein [Escherichia fergusonii]HCO7573562.1 siphovirus Gp157 family protein [Escherichia fergusonii]
MSSTAINIAGNIGKLQSLVESGEFTVDDIADTIEGEELALSEKFDGIMTLVRNLEGQANTVGEEAKRLADRKKSFEGQAKSLKEYALKCLQAANMKSFKTERNTFTVRKGSLSVVIDNVDQLPDDLVDIATVIAPDKKKIKEAIEAGLEIKGAHLETGAESLQVR